MENAGFCDNRSLAGRSFAAAMCAQPLPVLYDSGIRRSVSYDALTGAMQGPRGDPQKAVSHEAVDSLCTVEAKHWLNARPPREGFGTPWASPTRDGAARSFDVSQLAARFDDVSLARSLEDLLAWHEDMKNRLNHEKKTVDFSRLRNLPGTERGGAEGDVSCDPDCSEMDYDDDN